MIFLQAQENVSIGYLLLCGKPVPTWLETTVAYIGHQCPSIRLQPGPLDRGLNSGWLIGKAGKLTLMSARSSDKAMSSGTEHSCTQPHLLYGDWFLRMRIPREPMRRCTTLNGPVLEVSVTSTIVSSANKVKDREYWTHLSVGESVRLTSEGQREGK